MFKNNFILQLENNKHQFIFLKKGTHSKKKSWFFYPVNLIYDVKRLISMSNQRLYMDYIEQYIHVVTKDVVRSENQSSNKMTK